MFLGDLLGSGSQQTPAAAYALGGAVSPTTGALNVGRSVSGEQQWMALVIGGLVVAVVLLVLKK